LNIEIIKDFFGEKVIHKEFNRCLLSKKPTNLNELAQRKKIGKAMLNKCWQV